MLAECRWYEEKPSEDLEVAASRLGFDYVDNIVQESPGHRWNDHDVEFGYRDGFIAGAKWHEQQMMKEAVEFECIGKRVKMTVQELINYYIDTEQDSLYHTNIQDRPCRNAERL